MAGKLFIGFPIRQEFLFPGLPEDTDNVSLFTLLFKMAFNAKAGCALVYILLIGAAKIAFGEAEVIECIQQVSLADTIISTDTDDPFVEPKGSLAVVLELNDRYVFYAEQRQMNSAAKYYLSVISPYICPRPSGVIFTPVPQGAGLRPPAPV